MGKIYTALGMMSGTSGDGVDASIVKSDGQNECNVLLNKLYKYPVNISEKIHNLKKKILNETDLNKFSDEIFELEKIITNHHIDAAKDIKKKLDFDMIGFHGQTLLHIPEKKISKQIGEGNILSLELKKTVIHKFRDNDLINGGEGAPLAPIFHKLLINKNKINLPVTILNIGGISNITTIDQDGEISASDIGPGNCLIDKWIRISSNNNFDKDGLIARSGKIDKQICSQQLEDFYNSSISKKKSFDTNDFWFTSSIRGLSIENGAATLNEITSEILSNKLKNKNIYVSGGGRKNLFLIETIEKKIGKKIKSFDDLGVNGDFIESQAFAYLAIRSFLKFPITFPRTTGCSKPSTGGVIVNF